MEKFVFISYKSEDREQIRPWLEVLEQAGIKYWWDQQLDHEWGREIDQKLEQSAAVIGFLTERASTSAPVWVEFNRAKDAGKLIPVRLDKAKLSYQFEAVIAFLNYIDLSGESSEKREVECRRLLGKILDKTGMGSSEAVGVPRAVPALARDDLATWFQAEGRLSHLAYIVSLCFFEGQSHDFIQLCAASLEQKLDEARLGDLLGFRKELTTKTRRLRLVRAQATRYHSKLTNSEIELVEFDDHLFGEKALLYIWNEFDQIKLAIIEWVDLLLHKYPSQCIGDIAATLSKMGRYNFLSIYVFLLRRWLSQRVGSPHFRCADITLSLLVDVPDIKHFVREQLLQISSDEPIMGVDAVSSESEQSADQDAPPDEIKESSDWMLRREAGIALVTGYTGMSMPDLLTALFKQMEEDLLKDDAEVTDAVSLRAIDDGIASMLETARVDTHARALTLVFAQKGLRDWIQEDAGSRKSYLAEFIFLRLLSHLTLMIAGRRRKGISLQDLLAGDVEFESSTLDAFGKIISSALESKNFFIRDSYVNWMKSWRDKLNGEFSKRESSVKVKEECLVFKALFDAAMKNASGINDVERIEMHTKLNFC